MRLSPWTAGVLAIGALAIGLFAWQRAPGDAAGGPSVTQAPPPASPPARVAAPAPAPARRQALPAIAEAPPLNVQLDRLLATHDPEDAYRAYRLVADCATFNRNHDRIIFDQEDLEHPTGDALPGFRTMTEEEKRHEARLCDGLTERQRQSRLDDLAIAAKAGVPGAAVDFATEGPFGDPSALETRPNDPLVQAWKASAIDQLTRAAEAGAEPGALQYLADQYASGAALTGKNPLLAYRYLVAMDLIDQELHGPADPAAASLSAQREQSSDMLRDFSPEQLAFELAAARHIADLAKARREQARRKPAPGG